MCKFGKGNRANKTHCRLCWTIRPAAARPSPKELADAKAEAVGKAKKEPQPPKAPGAPVSKRQQRRDARALKKKLADEAEGWEGWVEEIDEDKEEQAPLAAAAVGDTPGTPAAQAAGGSLGAQPALSAATKERLKALGLPPQPLTVNFVTRYPVPSKLTLLTPKEVVASALAGNASVKAAQLKEAVVKQGAAAQSAADSFGAKHQITLLAQAELKRTKEELTAVEEHAPPAISKPAAQKIARACRKAQERHTERSQKDDAGMEKAEAKFTEDVAALRSEIAGLEERIVSLTSAQSASQGAWRSRLLALSAHEIDVIREFKDQVSLASPNGLEADFLEDELDSSKVDEELTKLEDLELASEEISLVDIPVILLEGATEDDSAILNAIGAFYLSAPVCVSLPAVSYTLLGVADPTFVKNIVGSKIWSAIYKDKVPCATDWVPRQLVEILRCGMNNLAAQLTKRTDHTQAVIDAKARMAQAKANARSSPYST